MALKIEFFLLYLHTDLFYLRILFINWLKNSQDHIKPSKARRLFIAIRGVSVSLFDFSALWLAVITVYAVWSLLLRPVHVHLVIYSHYAFIYRRTVNNWNVSSSEILILVGQNCFDFDRLRTKWEKCFQNSSINYISWYYMLKMKISYIRVGEYFVYRGITHMQL